MRHTDIIATPSGSSVLGDGGSREGVLVQGTTEQHIIVERFSYSALASTHRKDSFGCRGQTPVRDKSHLSSQQTPSGNPHTLFPLLHSLLPLHSGPLRVRARPDPHRPRLQVLESGRFQFLWIMGPDRVYATGDTRYVPQIIVFSAVGSLSATCWA
jgi:hypothetical protein